MKKVCNWQKIVEKDDAEKKLKRKERVKNVGWMGT
jgi:hypothetical protein